jgi:casein kinase 1
LVAPREKKHQRIGEKKRTTAIKDLCESSPNELDECLQYIHGLKFGQEPDYDSLRALLTQALENSGEIEDGKYDWDKRGAEPESAPTFSSQIPNDARPSERRELREAGRVTTTRHRSTGGKSCSLAGSSAEKSG